ncbi:MAG: hypothetical protein LUB63_03105, partial [Oscillospiraceae bacterium]|nr:hypothetical protein [Oscillospiraceae bacterium]
MKVNVKYEYTQDFLPTKRHRKLRHQSAEAVATVEVREVTAEQFPVAFIVHDDGWSYEEGQEVAVWGTIHTEIRTIGDKLYKA